MNRVIVVLLSLNLVASGVVIWRQSKQPASVAEVSEDVAVRAEMPTDIIEVEPGQSEAFYRDLWIKENGGEPEVTLDDGSRVDILTDDFAIEVESADNWKEGVGQALHYGFMTNKMPALVLTVEKHEYRHFIALNSVLLNYEIPVETRMIRCW